MRGHGETTRTWRATRWLVVAALIVGVAGVPSPADAATSWWTAEDRLGGDESSITEMHEVVLTHDDRLLLVYSTSNALRARLQSDDGRWGAPTDLFTSPYVATSEGSAVVTADATFVVFRAAGGVDIARLDGDTWTDLPALGESAEHMDAAVTPEGDVAVSWTVGFRETAEVGTSTFDGTAWSPPSTTPVPGVWDRMTMAVAPDGTRVVAVDGATWTIGGVATPFVVHVLTADESGWSLPQPIADDTGHIERDGLVATGDGAVLVFTEVGSAGEAVVAAATFSAGSWTTARLGSGPEYSVPALAVGPDGRPQVAMVAEGTHPEPWAEIRIFRQRAGGSWSAAETAVRLDGIGWNGGAVGTAIGPEGTELVAAGILDLVNPTLVVGLRGQGRPWQSPSVHGPNLNPVEEVHPVIEPDGLVHLVWQVQNREWYSTSGFVVPFDDLVPGAFYVWPVLWAAEVGLTTGVGGTDEFQPNRSITRAEAITTLWRFAGSPPAPAAGFSDTAVNAFYSSAVNWARHTGLTTGVAGSNRFEPNRTITRAELVTLLWRFDGSRGAPSGGFADVPSGAFFAPAVNWAKSVGITTGVGGTNRFEPNREVTRAEAFTFVYRLAASVDLSLAATEQSPLGMAPAEPLD